ncbi:hypothetical protein BY457_11489 [Marinilabilia salmonicolor]|jgi:hypothetical protein|uniref:hypothetical protein n=1 Tax=Marinilabilia salmonicolor TaxID=989 RepID=UPI000D3FB168|nr:hypothetical protein [Marinilabilia salmonicolor]PRY96705.1 hypothetical protein BY457_11489 [Marinilabilia salmonicolor]
MDVYESHLKVTIAKIRALYPELVEDCKPIIPEMTKTQMRAVFDAFIDLRGSMPESNKENEITLLVAVFALFFDPDYLNGFKKKARVGFRPIISEFTGIKERLLSYYFKQALNQTVVRRFRDEVISTAKIISDLTGLDLEL